MHIVNRKMKKKVELMMESKLKIMNRVNNANYYFNKFLSASAWSSLSSLISYAESSV